MSSGVRLRIQSFIDTKKRQSFSERVCDDLSQVLLQYLTIEDKLRLECVSKQFRRTLFENHRHLDVPEYLLKKRTELKSLLKKCPNITEVIVHKNDNTDHDSQYKETIEMMPKYCRQLRAIKEHHIMNVINFWTDASFFPINALIKLKLNYLEHHFIDLLNLIARNQILNYLSIYNFTGDLQQFIVIAKQVSKLKSLTHLKFMTNFGLNHKSLVTEMRRIGGSCGHLKSIKCKLVITADDFSNIENVFSVFTHLKELKRANFDVEIAEPIISNVQILKAFNGLSALTHLTLSLHFSVRPESSLIDETILKDIHLFLPKLQSFRIKEPMIGSTRIAHLLSQLSSLETIRLQIRDESIRRPIARILTENCRKIKFIELNAIVS